MTTNEPQDLLPQTKTIHPSLWRNRDYMLLWAGQTVSAIGNNITTIALPLLILDLTNSPSAAGFAEALRAVPYLLLSLPVGAFIDSWNRKRVMIICDFGRAASLSSIVIALALHILTITQIYIVAVLGGTLFVFFDLAEVSSLARVVPKEQLPQATGQNQATFGIATLIGAPLGGAIYGIGKIFPFVGNVIGYTGSAISLMAIKTKFQEDRTSKPKTNIIKDIIEGLRWLWEKPLIRYMAFLTGSLNLIESGLFLALIIIARAHGATPVEIGFIGSIVAVGGIIGSVIGAFIQQKFTFGQVIIATLWIQGAAIALTIISANFILLGFFAGIALMMGPIYNVVQFSYRISLIPDHLQGRVNSVFRLLAYGGIPIGEALSGIGLQYFGAIPVIIIMSSLIFFVAIITSLNSLVRDANPISAEAKA